MEGFGAVFYETRFIFIDTAILKLIIYFTHTLRKKTNKSEFVDAVASDIDITKADAAKAVDSVVNVITNALKDGDQLNLIGFGSFQVKDRAARTGRNPRTGEAIEIKASKMPTFKAGKALKDAVN